MLLMNICFQVMSTYFISRGLPRDRHSSKNDLREELRRVIKHLDEGVTRGFYDLGHPDVKHEVVWCAHRVTKLIVALAEKRRDQHPDYHVDCGFEYLKYY